MADVRMAYVAIRVRADRCAFHDSRRHVDLSRAEKGTGRRFFGHKNPAHRQTVTGGLLVLFSKVVF